MLYSSVKVDPLSGVLGHDDLHNIEYSKLKHEPQEESSFIEGTVGYIDSVLRQWLFFL